MDDILSEVDNSCCFYQDCRSSSTEDVSGDWFHGVNEVDLADLKQETYDVCYILRSISIYYDRKKLQASSVTNRSCFCNCG